MTRIVFVFLVLQNIARIFARTCNKENTFCLRCDKEQFNAFVKRSYVAGAIATNRTITESAVTLNGRPLSDCRGSFQYNRIVDGYILQVPLGKDRQNK